MKVLPDKNRILWLLTLIAVVAAIIIYRIGFRFPVPGFNEEAVTSLEIAAKNAQAEKGGKRLYLIHKADIDNDPELEEIRVPYWFPIPTYIGSLLVGPDVVAIRPYDFGLTERDWGSTHGYGKRMLDDAQRTGFMFVGIQQEAKDLLHVPITAIDPVAPDKQLNDGTLMRSYSFSSNGLHLTIERKTRLVESSAAPTGKLFEETLTLFNRSKGLNILYWSENLECDDEASVHDADGDKALDTMVCLNSFRVKNFPAIAKVYTRGPIYLIRDMPSPRMEPQRVVTIRQPLGQSVPPQGAITLSKAYYVVSNAKPPEDCVRQVLDCAKILLIKNPQAENQ